MSSAGNSKDSDIKVLYHAREERKAAETGRVLSSTRLPLKPVALYHTTCGFLAKLPDKA